MRGIGVGMMRMQGMREMGVGMRRIRGGNAGNQVGNAENRVEKKKKKRKKFVKSNFLFLQKLTKKKTKLELS